MYNKMNETKSSIVGSGNGVRKNSYLIKALEDLFSGKLKTPLHQEEAAFGSALFGLIAIKRFSSVKDAQKIIIYS